MIVRCKIGACPLIICHLGIGTSSLWSIVTTEDLGLLAGVKPSGVPPLALKSWSVPQCRQ